MDASGALGTSRLFTTTVLSHMSATAMGSGGIEVLSTPWMIALMEMASRDLVQQCLPPEYTTVGTRVNVSHLAPVPVGAQVTVNSRLVEARDRKLVFEVEVVSGDVTIGSGTHERAVVNTEKFRSRFMKGG